MSAEYPVVIAGAGPCGLLTAITLQRRNVPFVVLERAPRSKHTADVGSGYDIAPTVQEILRRLEISEEGWCTPFVGTVLMDVHGAIFRRTVYRNSSGPIIKAATRSAMQNKFLEVLGDKADIRYGVAVTGYAQISQGVIVSLDDGTTVMGRALLGCDGIHSAVRRCMFYSNPPRGIHPPLEDSPDTFHFCGFEVWWGKCLLPPGSSVRRLLDETQGIQDGRMFVWALGSTSHPGCFMGSVLPSAEAMTSNSVFAWAFSRRAQLLPSGDTDDLTRRGAVTGLAAKDDLKKIVNDLCPLIKEIVAASDAEYISKCTVYQRSRLDLPYSDGRVALLGDAAHPQCPFLGQGLNMALTDAYVCAERLAAETVETALFRYDVKSRQTGVNKLIERAKWMGDIAVSDSWLTTLSLHALARWGPVIKWLLEDPVKSDECNRATLEVVINDLQLPPSPPQPPATTMNHPFVSV